MAAIRLYGNHPRHIIFSPTELPPPINGERDTRINVLATELASVLVGAAYYQLAEQLTIYLTIEEKQQLKEVLDRGY